MISRRGFLSGASAAVLALSPLRSAWSFSVRSPREPRVFFIYRKSNRIGTHRVSFSGDHDDFNVSVSVEIDVRFGPFPLYRYRHAAIEHWRASRFESLNAQTDDNGTHHRVAVARDGAGFRIDGSRGAQDAPFEVLPATHWNRHQLDAPMVNTQTGEILRPDIRAGALETIAGVDGDPIAARRFALSGDADFDLWYDERDRWVGLSFLGEDGAEIRYLAA